MRHEKYYSEILTQRYVLVVKSIKTGTDIGFPELKMVEIL